jgi:hypothetical protein
MDIDASIATFRPNSVLILCSWWTVVSAVLGERARARELEYLNGSGCMFGDETCKTFDTHFVVVVIVVVRVWVATRPDEINVTCDWRVCHGNADGLFFDHHRFEGTLTD